MSINVNGAKAATADPASYITLDRTWSSGDIITFRLPMELKLTRYIGLDKIEGHERFALEYGPILLALVGSDSAVLKIDGVGQIKPDPDRPLHFNIDGHLDYSYIPY